MRRCQHTGRGCGKQVQDGSERNAGQVAVESGCCAECRVQGTGRQAGRPVGDIVGEVPFSPRCLAALLWELGIRRTRTERMCTQLDTATALRMCTSYICTRIPVIIRTL